MTPTIALLCAGFAVLYALHFLAPLFTFVLRAFFGFAFLALACALVLFAAFAAMLERKENV